MKVFRVYARLDADAQVWYVHQSDVPGLHAEAETLDELLAELLTLVPELINANGQSIDGGNQNQRQVPIDLIAQQRSNPALAC